MKNLMIVCAAAVVAAYVAGCVPGEAEIKVKSSELRGVAGNGCCGGTDA